MAALYVQMAAFVGTVYHNPVDDVVVTSEATPVTDNDWVRAQLKRGHIVECEAPPPPPAPAVVEESANAASETSEVEPEPHPE